MPYVQLSPDETGKKVQMFENTISGQTLQAMAVTLIDPTGWSDSYVEVAESTGKKVQYFENTISGNVVQAIALVLVDTTGVAI